MTQELPEKALKELGLEGRTEVLFSEDPDNFIFVGLGLIRVSYATKVEKNNHYLCKDDPYYVVRGECNAVSMNGSVPEEFTHYTLGLGKQIENVSYGKNKTGSSTDLIPIAFLRKLE